MRFREAEVADAVISVLQEIGVPESDIRADAHLLRIMVEEDATFWFISAVEKRLHVEIPPDEWGAVFTIQEAIDLLGRYVADQRKPD